MVETRLDPNAQPVGQAGAEDHVENQGEQQGQVQQGSSTGLPLASSAISTSREGFVAGKEVAAPDAGFFSPGATQIFRSAEISLSTLPPEQVDDGVRVLQKMFKIVDQVSQKATNGMDRLFEDLQKLGPLFPKKK